jgi:hypothetical protein
MTNLRDLLKDFQDESILIVEEKKLDETTQDIEDLLEDKLDEYIRTIKDRIIG